MTPSEKTCTTADSCLFVHARRQSRVRKRMEAERSAGSLVCASLRGRNSSSIGISMANTSPSMSLLSKIVAIATDGRGDLNLEPQQQRSHRDEMGRLHVKGAAIATRYSAEKRPNSNENALNPPFSCSVLRRGFRCSSLRALCGCVGQTRILGAIMTEGELRCQEIGANASLVCDSSVAEAALPCRGAVAWLRTATDAYHASLHLSAVARRS